MWSHVESQYRAQANSGVIITIDEDAMNKAIKNAGNVVFDTEWWVETLPIVLEHWGLRNKRWLDPTTHMPHVHYRLTNDRVPTGTTGPLNGEDAVSIPKGTGPLMTRILNAGKSATGPLDSGKLNSGGLSDRLNSDRLKPENLNSGGLSGGLNSGGLSGRLNSGKLRESGS
jgi:hypothetical protein